MKHLTGVLLVTFCIYNCSTSNAPQNDAGINTKNQEVTVEITRPIQVNPNARFPTKDPSFDHAEVMDNKLILHYKQKPSIELQPGQIIVGGPVGFIRKIKSISFSSETQLEVQTEDAYLGDIILDGAFHIHQKPLAERWDLSHGSIETKTQGLTENTFSFFKEFHESAGVSCKVTAGRSLQLDPTFDLTPEFDITVDYQYSLLPYVHGELYQARFYIGGTIAAGIDVTTKGSLSANCEADFIDYLRKKAKDDKLFRGELPSIEVMVGPVPVWITHHIEPIITANLAAQINLPGLKFGGHVNLDTGAGAEYKNGKWAPIANWSRSGKVGLELTEDSGEASLTNSLSIGLAYVALIYDTAGPKVGLQATGAAALTATPMTCKWKADISLGMDVVFGAMLQVPVIDKKIWDASGNINLFKVPITEYEDDLPFCRLDGGVEAGLDGGLDAKVDAPSMDSMPSDAGIPDAPKPDNQIADLSNADHFIPDSCPFGACCSPLLQFPLPGCTNIAGGKTYTASYTYSNSYPKNVVDGNVCNVWNGAYVPAWWQIDLGSPQSIRGLVVIACMTPATGLVKHEIQTSMDGSNFTTRYTYNKSMTVDNIYTFDFGSNIVSRYVRIDTTLSPSWVCWKEIAVFTCP